MILARDSMIVGDLNRFEDPLCPPMERRTAYVADPIKDGG